MPTVTVRLFAQAREAVGQARLRRELPTEGRSLSEELAGMARDYPKLAAVLPRCRFARNGEFVDPATARLAGGDDIAVHPPYSGG